jgi:hypothetical protein
MATYPITKQPIANVRDLIVALRKVSNNNALVFLDCGNERQFIGEVQVTDMLAPMVSMVHIVGSKVPSEATK